MPEDTLKQKEPSARNLGADVVQFLGWLTLMFAIHDLVLNGTWRDVAAMVQTQNGRLLVVLTGVASAAIGWLLRHRK